MAKVSAASPRVAVRKAGFLNSPQTVARFNVGMTRSLAPRSGSVPTHPYSAANANPGMPSSPPAT